MELTLCALSLQSLDVPLMDAKRLAARKLKSSALRRRLLLLLLRLPSKCFAAGKLQRALRDETEKQSGAARKVLEVEVEIKTASLFLVSLSLSLSLSLFRSLRVYLLRWRLFSAQRNEIALLVKD